MSETAEVKAVESRLHWPTVILGVIVAAIFLFAIFSYQVKQSEKAVVMTFGNITGITEPGLHFRWPMPIQTIVYYDIRCRSFDGNIGKYEETMTHDQKNIIIGINVVYHISNPEAFYRAAGNVAFAEEKLGSIMRTAKNAIIGKYRFDEIINTDPAKMQISKIEDEIRAEIDSRVVQANYGLAIDSVGLRTVGVPESSSKAIAARMVEERKIAATDYRSNGQREANEIRVKADQDRAKIMADADAEAKSIRAEGDAEAATHYASFSANPELASFLRKIESLKRILSSKATLVLDTDSAPFDIMGKASTGVGSTDGKTENRAGK